MQVSGSWLLSVEGNVKSIVLAVAIISAASSVNAQAWDLAGEWLCTRSCLAPGQILPTRITEGSDGSVIFWANVFGPNQWRDIGRGIWIDNNSLFLKPIRGKGYDKPGLTARIMNNNWILFSDGSEWRRR